MVCKSDTDICQCRLKICHEEQETWNERTHTQLQVLETYQYMTKWSCFINFHCQRHYWLIYRHIINCLGHVASSSKVICEMHKLWKDMFKAPFEGFTLKCAQKN